MRLRQLSGVQINLQSGHISLQRLDFLMLYGMRRCPACGGAALMTCRTRAKASSRAITQLLNKIGWLTMKGAMPKPVEFPMPKLRAIAGSSAAHPAPPFT